MFTTDPLKRCTRYALPPQRILVSSVTDAKGFPAESFTILLTGIKHKAGLTGQVEPHTLSGRRWVVLNCFRTTRYCPSESGAMVRVIKQTQKSPQRLLTLQA